MGKREVRQEAIRSIVRRYPIRTQTELAERLQSHGFDCTQATVSRDITDMGLVKGPSGAYAVPEDLRLQRLLSDMVVSVRYAMNQVVVRTVDGAAAGVAGALDKAELAEVLGTVAGDDTILVITEDNSAAEKLAHSIMVFCR